MAGKPKAGFWIVVILVVLGLGGFALYKAGILAPEGTTTEGGGDISKDDLNQVKTGGDKAVAGGDQKALEAPDSNAPTTVKEYSFVAAAKLPEVKGTSSFEPMKDNTVRFALNVWAGWAPIVWANQGFKPGKEWEAPGGKKFKVELVLIDDPVAMRDAYATGNVHIGWATLDMVPLFLEQLRKDPRVMPRIYQQVDWSNGGDGIVARGVDNIGGLRGKTIVLAQNSPSHYFVLNALINAGVQPSEVKFKFTQDAFQAAAAFNADKSIAACVSWAPDIYNLSKIKGNKLLVSTEHVNEIIAPTCGSPAPTAPRITPRWSRAWCAASSRPWRTSRIPTTSRRSPSSWARATASRPQRPSRCWATPTAPTTPRTGSSS